MYCNCKRQFKETYLFWIVQWII